MSSHPAQAIVHYSLFPFSFFLFIFLLLLLLLSPMFSRSAYGVLQSELLNCVFANLKSQHRCRKVSWAAAISSALTSASVSQSSCVIWLGSNLGTRDALSLCNMRGSLRVSMQCLKASFPLHWPLHLLHCGGWLCSAIDKCTAWLMLLSLGVPVILSSVPVAVCCSVTQRARHLQVFFHCCFGNLLTNVFD